MILLLHVFVDFDAYMCTDSCSVYAVFLILHVFRDFVAYRYTDFTCCVFGVLLLHVSSGFVFVPLFGAFSWCMTRRQFLASRVRK